MAKSPAPQLSDVTALTSKQLSSILSQLEANELKSTLVKGIPTIVVDGKVYSLFELLSFLGTV
jgi:hypothetical protein